MSRFLKEIDAFIDTQPFDIIRLSQSYRGGEIETLERTRTNPCQNVYSVAKTFTMTALGLLFDRGLLRPDEKICDILKDELPESGMDERWRGSTVEMALTHRLGLPGGFLDIDVSRSSEFTEDFLGYTLTYPLAYEPGAEARYSDGAYYLLARVAEKKAGMPVDNFLWRELLTKLDFQEMAWSHCPRGHVIGATGLYVNSIDMVKLGLLYLDRGLYRGERMLSEEWVNLAIEREFALDWDEEHRIFYKGGMHGQKLIIAPEQGRVVALQAFGANSQTIAEWVRDYGDRP
ncbi:MAG: beta-lactamase family protein [Clostridia bacterium]|nr:beta-lactamase family protein [Clostridia bacterium]MBO4884959.1 beta-lactamase family protein [Clostridia bacterium]